jgi:hypothetical protein
MRWRQRTIGRACAHHPQQPRDAPPDRTPHYPGFIAQMAAQDRPLPAYLREAFAAYLRCGMLAHCFLHVAEQCHAERQLAFSCKQRGPSSG